MKHSHFKKLRKKRNTYLRQRCLCGGAVLERMNFTGSTPFHGIFEFYGYHTVCLKCGDVDMEPNELVKHDNAMKEKASMLLQKYYQPDRYEYIPLEEIARLEGKDVEYLKLNCIDFYIFNTVWAGKKLYLKASYDIYSKNKKCGWFDITRPEDENTVSIEDYDWANSIKGTYCTYCGTPLIRHNYYSGGAFQIDAAFLLCPGCGLHYLGDDFARKEIEFYRKFSRDRKAGNISSYRNSSPPTYNTRVEDFSSAKYILSFREQIRQAENPPK